MIPSSRLSNGEVDNLSMQAGWLSTPDWFNLRERLDDLLLFKGYVDSVILTGTILPVTCPLSCWVSVSAVLIIGFGLWLKFWPKVREPMYTALSCVLIVALLLIVTGLPVGTYPRFSMAHDIRCLFVSEGPGDE